MRKVWTVESGEYSDYRVHEVFATEASANAWVAALSPLSSERYEVVERVLYDDDDVPSFKPQRLCSAVWFSNEDGPRVSHHDIRWPAEPTVEVRELGGPPCILVRAYAETEAKALKVCLDAGYRLAAELEGLT